MMISALSRTLFRRAISLSTEHVICFGHTHKPWQRTVAGVRFINTGSVGRPKDGDWRSCYVLLEVDQSGARVEFVRVPYDVDAAARAIRESDLPDEFADVLKSGGKERALTY